MGGHKWASKDGIQRSVELYRLQSRTWSSLPDLQVARVLASSCCHGGYVYIFGGGTANDVTNKIEKLSLSYL